MRGSVRPGEALYCLSAAPATDWAREIAGLLDDPERAARMGAAARESVEVRYTFDVPCDRYEALDASLLAPSDGDSHSILRRAR